MNDYEDWNSSRSPNYTCCFVRGDKLKKALLCLIAGHNLALRPSLQPHSPISNPVHCSLSFFLAPTPQTRHPQAVHQMPQTFLLFLITAPNYSPISTFPHQPCRYLTRPFQLTLCQIVKVAMFLMLFCCIRYLCLICLPVWTAFLVLTLAFLTIL